MVEIVDDAALAASFHPRNAATTMGSRSGGSGGVMLKLPDMGCMVTGAGRHGRAFGTPAG
jgi:hypothetical protein